MRTLDHLLEGVRHSSLTVIDMRNWLITVEMLEVKEYINKSCQGSNF